MIKNYFFQKLLSQNVAFFGQFVTVNTYKHQTTTQCNIDYIYIYAVRDFQNVL